MVALSTRIPRLSAAGAIVVLCALAGAGPAFAQGISSNADELQAGEEKKGDTHVIDISEIERGFYLSVDYGANYFIPLKQANFILLNSDYVSPGTRMGLRAGYDIANNIQLDAFLVANFNEGTIDGNAIRGGILNGDLASFAPGIAVRFDYFTSEDQRFFAFVRAGLGYAFWFPQQLAVDSTTTCKETDPKCGAGGSIHTDASLGIEYFTKLRHLSIGLEVDVQALIAPTAIGIEAYPTIKYTF
ncbi:MAG TPA: adventurous gliding motility protein CglE [Myxococcota bacterium]